MIKLSDREWHSFLLNDLFIVESGKDITLYNNSGDLPYINSSGVNNGITKFVENGKKMQRNFISIARTGTVGATFYHDYTAVASGNVRMLRPKFFNFNKYIGMFFIEAIKYNISNRFSYGNILGTNRIKKIKLKLPVDYNNQPDYDFMERYIKEKYFNLKSHIKEKQKHKISDWRELDEVEWLPFSTSEVFNTIQRGKRLTKSNQIKGLTPYISSSGINNGLDNFISNSEKIRVFDNCLTIANSGSVGSTFYHTYRFIASDHVTHLKNNNLNKFTYLFIANMLCRLEGKYSFNREINDFRIKRERILLPTKNNQPDYEFMEQYMKRKENEILDRL